MFFKRIIDLTTHGTQFLKIKIFFTAYHYSNNFHSAKNGMTIENQYVTLKMVAIHKTIPEIIINQSKLGNSKSKNAK